MAGLITPAMYTAASRAVMATAKKAVGTALARRKTKSTSKRKKKAASAVKAAKRTSKSSRVTRLVKGSAAAKAWGKKMAKLRGK